MAEVINTIGLFPGVVVYLVYEDTDLLITRVQIINNSPVDVYAQVNKLDPPKRSLDHTWHSGDSDSFDVSTGRLHYTIDPTDNTLTLENITIFVRYG